MPTKYEGTYMLLQHIRYIDTLNGTFVAPLSTKLNLINITTVKVHSHQMRRE